MTHQKRKRDTADRNGSVDAVGECIYDQGSVSEDRKGNTAYTGVTT